MTKGFRLRTPRRHAVALSAALVGALLFCCALGGLRPASCGEPAPGAEIKHRFLLVDESRSQLLYVDQTNPAKDWKIQFPGKCRDIQLSGKDNVLVSTPDGYREYSLQTREVVKEVKGYGKAVAARRLADGKTLLACNQDGVTVYELDAADKVLRKANFKVGETRLVRLTPQGTFLFGSGAKVIEGDLDGKTVKVVALPNFRGVYQALRKPNGNLLLATGYDASLLETRGDGKVLKTFGGKQAPELKEFGYYFFAGFQTLKNGHFVVSNWTGHGAKDSAKGTQVLEYDEAGKVVWKWHEPERAGSIHGVIVLDDLDPKVLHDDLSSVLGPVK